MEKTIHILPQQLADKIAAGEVVGRPASAVKELIENSIDANATSISIVIKDGGTSLIQVIDNGTGMSAEDARLAFARHATSKIASYDDLENIRTLGFRGEALASIAAVSHVELRTRLQSSDVGTKVKIDGGEHLEVLPEATAPGTIISVRNLFYNTPGRRNFLKSPQTEYKYIVDVFQRAALAHPSVAMKLISNEETIFSLPSATLHERVKELLGEQLSSTLLSFEEKTEFAGIQGFLGKPDFARKTRTEQYLYLNNRSIANRNINHAVYQGYENMLEKGSFPVFILFINIDPHRVDVNVHPSKMEVKFEDESSMYRFVLTSVRKALSASDLIPAAGSREEHQVGNFSDFRMTTQPSGAGQRTSQWKELFQSESSFPKNIFPQPATTPSAGEIFKRDDPKKSDDKNDSDAQRSLWQVHNKYIIVSTAEGIMLVDQHAAHERVLYERAVVRMNGGEHPSQQLLFPRSVELSVGDVSLVSQLLPMLESLGFNLKIFGKTTVIVDGVPTDIKPGEEGTILQQLIDLYKEDEQSVKLEPRERLAKSYSCKAAIKAGDPLKDDEMHALLDQLFQTEVPFTCPHGRPVIIKLSLSELDRRFGRTS